MSAGIPTNIKKFFEFEPVRKRWKMLNKIYIKGKLKGSFWKKEVDFEMVVVYTNLKNLIVDVQLLEGNTSLKDDRFNIDFGVGGHIDKAKEWVSKNSHKIDVDVIK